MRETSKRLVCAPGGHGLPMSWTAGGAPPVCESCGKPPGPGRVVARQRRQVGLLTVEDAEQPPVAVNEVAVQCVEPQVVAGRAAGPAGVGDEVEALGLRD